MGLCKETPKEFRTVLHFALLDPNPVAMLSVAGVELDGEIVGDAFGGNDIDGDGLANFEDLDADGDGVDDEFDNCGGGCRTRRRGRRVWDRSSLRRMGGGWNGRRRCRLLPCVGGSVVVGRSGTWSRMRCGVGLGAF